MQRIKAILEKISNKINLDINDYIYLQGHQKEAQETQNIKLIEISKNISENNPSYVFKKII